MFDINGTTWQKCQTRTPQIIRPFRSSRNSYFKNEAKYKAFKVKMNFICIRIKNYFHINDLGCVPLEKLDLDFKIRTSDLQSNAKSENGFQPWDICFCISFLPFDWEIRKRIRKTVLKISGLVRACIISSKKKTAVFQILFRISQSNGKK